MVDPCLRERYSNVPSPWPIAMGRKFAIHGFFWPADASHGRLCNSVIAVILRPQPRRFARMAGAQAQGRSILSIPNLITLARILLVPVVVWAITAGEMKIAFLLFLAAGVSDAVDG